MSIRKFAYVVAAMAAMVLVALPLMAARPAKGLPEPVVAGGAVQLFDTGSAKAR